MMTERISGLRRGMIVDMNARGLSEGSQRAHVRSCKRFAAFLGRSPETASREGIRRFQLHLAEGKVSIVLNPALHHVLVREIIDVLQIVKPDHQPCRLCLTIDRFEESSKALIERQPRHQRRQMNQAMAHVDDRIETLTKKIGTCAATADRPNGKHRKSGLQEPVPGIISQTSPQKNPFDSIV